MRGTCSLAKKIEEKLDLSPCKLHSTNRASVDFALSQKGSLTQVKSGRKVMYAIYGASTAHSFLHS